MANRLSADPKNRVLLLEAGGQGQLDLVPHSGRLSLRHRQSARRLDVQDRAGARPQRPRAAYPRGKVIGGSLGDQRHDLHARPGADYDHWRQLGLTGWGWDDVLPVFKKLEDHFLGDSEHHGVGGGWRVEAPRVRWACSTRSRGRAEMGIRKTPTSTPATTKASAISTSTRSAACAGRRRAAS
jgi:choline dehydrogenase-like flavoprotein